MVLVNPPVTQPQVSRTGGGVAALDNGNFVVVSDDRTGYLDPDTELTSFSIITPTGAIVKSATLVDLNDIWDNVAAYRGGFAIRCHALLYFFDNTGNPTHTNDINISSGLSFGTGRGDASRIGSDIRSYYVYLAGQSPENNATGNPIFLAIWDSRTGNFVAKAQVSDSDPAVSKNDRVNLAVDALDRCCVAWGLQPDGTATTPKFALRQVAARVMAFDGANIRYLTHSFFPFVNYDPDGSSGLQTFHPSVAMTTRQICIAAKGTINSANNPAGGPDTAAETTLYTVISTPVSGSPTLTVSRSGNNLLVSWPTSFIGFAVQSTDSLSPINWSTMTPQPSITQSGGNNVATIPIGAANKFYRLRQ